MAGERTPDNSPPSGRSSDDNISLREHLQRQLDMHMESQNLALKVAIDAVTALSVEQDRRYEQRFIAQEQAVTLALSRVDKEFHEHLKSAKDEVQAALLASDKAITKSEIATEKRFESVNEFRAQLGDQARTFMPRDESINRHDRTAEQIKELQERADKDRTLMRERFDADIKTLRDRHDADTATINSRLDLTAGQSKGLDKSWALLVGAVGFLATIGGIIATVVAFTN